jgi:hypothetical protein
MVVADGPVRKLAAPTLSRARLAVFFVMASLVGWAFALPAAAASRVPAGMIPYDKPVYKNGRRVLYHGPSHGGGKAAAARAPAKSATAPTKSVAKPVKSSGKPADAATAPSAVPAAPDAVRAGTLGPAVAAPPIAVDATPRARVSLAMDPRLGAELVQALAARGVEATLIPNGPADLFVAPLAPSGKGGVGAGRVAIARLFDCEIAVIGGADMRTIGDLAGKRVAAPALDSGAGATARRLFEAAGVGRVRFVETSDPAGAMRSGQADGYVVLAPSPELADTPVGARLLATPYTGALREQFLPIEFQKSAFPTLIEGDAIDSVAQPMLLAAADPGSDAAKRLALTRFTDAFFSALSSGAPPDPKWRDVNPAAKLPVSRFEAAQAWIDKARRN